MSSEHDPPKFTLDPDLFPLCKALRMLGFDALYRGNMALGDALQRSIEEHRIWLKRFSEKSVLQYGVSYFALHAVEVPDQLREIDARYSLAAFQNPFSRCLKCDQILEKTASRAVRDKVPERVFATFQQFWRCPNCARIYWPGSHWQRMKKRLEAWGWSV